MFEELTSKSTFEEWSKILYRKKRVRVSEGRLDNIACRLSLINKFIGQLPVDEIKPYQIDDMLSDLSQNNPNTNRPMAKCTLKDVRDITAAVFDILIENDLMVKNPAAGRELPHGNLYKRRRAITFSEQMQVISTPHRCRVCALLMMFCGLRRGELIPLSWSDLKLDTRIEVDINKSVYRMKNRANIFIIKSGAKSEAGERTVPIPLDLALFLKKEREKAVSPFITHKLNGEMHTPSSWKAMWNSYQCSLNAAYGFMVPRSKYSPYGLPKVKKSFTPHDLRHTYATLLYKSGVDVLTASRLLGHESVVTTLEIYTHLEKSMVKKSIDKFDAYVREIFKEAF